MQLDLQTNGGAAAKVQKVSATLPFGEQVPLSSISGPTYVTAQLLVQQVAYNLSEKIFSYSPETFDLDVAATAWAENKEQNAQGTQPTVFPLQARTGAGAFALGYIFSPDYDLSKRHIPQSLLAPTSSLQNLRESLDQLSLLYGVSNPLVAHLPAVDYSVANGLTSSYGPALQAAEDLGLGLVSSTSTYEVQHMALFATLLASLVPTLHTYDGVRLARETTRVVDVLSSNRLAETYKTVLDQIPSLNQRLDVAGKAVEILRLLNEELGTDYEPFEYNGHRSARTVLVTFGSSEALVAKQVAMRLTSEGAKVGVINVRLYRPFVEELFLKALPASTRNIIVLGQVATEADAKDTAVQSPLFNDVLAAVSFSGRLANEPAVVEHKYSVAQVLDPAFFLGILDKTADVVEEDEDYGSFIQANQHSFWNLDNAPAAQASASIAKLLSSQSKNNISVYETHDNLVQGGIVRTEIRSARRSLEAPYSISEANVAVVGDETILKAIDIPHGVKIGGQLIVSLPNFKAEDVEKRLSPAFRKSVLDKRIGLYALDATASPLFASDAGVQLLSELAFLKVTQPSVKATDVANLVPVGEGASSLDELFEAVSSSLHKVEVSLAWGELPADYAAPHLSRSVKTTSFVPFDKDETEEEIQVNDWQAAAKGFTFKEAYGTQTKLRPDLTVKTSTVTVIENRRLTPETYDRNIFHIEFDLGTSGLTYNIGEALGIHAENDKADAEDFIQFYGLNHDDLVSVPSREDPAVLDTRTVYQSLIQNVDILGKPPKRFYEALSEFATDEAQKKKLEALGGQSGAEEFKRRSDVDTLTYVDVLKEFTSARPAFQDLVRIVAPLKRREYSIASAQAVTPTAVTLMIVVVDWVDSQGRKRYGHASRYLSLLRPGAKVTVSVKPSVMKLPVRDDAPLIMAGLGTGLAPFRAFVQYRAMQKAQGKKIGAILLYLGSRHRREEYLYGEEWEAYLDAGVITLLGCAFSRDQKEKIYIQDRMRQTQREIIKAYVENEGAFYLCGPTWPVPDVTKVLEEAIATHAVINKKKVDPKKEIEKLKEESRYVLEVY